MRRFRELAQLILIPTLVFAVVFVGHLLFYKIVSQNSSPIWWRLYVLTQTYLISFSLALAFAFGAYALIMAKGRSGKAVAGSAGIALLVWFTSACGAPLIVVGLGLIGVSFGAEALPPWVTTLLTLVFISFGVYWLHRKGAETCGATCCATTGGEHADLYKEIGVNIEKFGTQQCIAGDLYKRTFTTQQNRPAAMSYFDDMVADIYGPRIREIMAAKKQGQIVVGNFCVFVPEELTLAVGGISVGLCAGSQAPIADAEKVLPRNICPLVKSAYGYALTKSSPYFQVVDFVCGETTCDAKKKTWELMDREISTYVMEIPQMKREKDRSLWLDEIKDFKSKLETLSKRTITAESLANAIEIMNRKRAALQRLNSLRYHRPTPISGRDALLVEQIAFYDDPVRFSKKVNVLCDELENRVRDGIFAAPVKAPRVMISGSPMALPNWKIHNLVEGAGAVVVNEESCVGTRYFSDQVASVASDLDLQLAALTERYMKINCACFTPNQDRIEQIIRECRASYADGIIHYSLQFCHTYIIEAVRVREACVREGIPFLGIESDYSTEDTGQLQTRIEAFLEQIGGGK